MADSQTPSDGGMILKGILESESGPMSPVPTTSTQSPASPSGGPSDQNHQFGTLESIDQQPVAQSAPEPTPNKLSETDATGQRYSGRIDGAQSGRLGVDHNRDTRMNSEVPLIGDHEVEITNGAVDVDRAISDRNTTTFNRQTTTGNLASIIPMNDLLPERSGLSKIISERQPNLRDASKHQKFNYHSDHHIGMAQEASTNTLHGPMKNHNDKKTKMFQPDDDYENPENKAPQWALMLTLLLIGTTAGVVNALTVLFQAYLQKLRKYLIKDYYEGGDWLGPGAIKAGYSAGLCIVACALVLFIAPKAAGSGVPEVKGYLNGCKIKDLFGKFGWVRAVAVIFSVTSGLPLGREGPMVGTGCQIGLYWVDVILKHYYQEEFTLKDADGNTVDVKNILDVAKFHYVRRRCAMLGSVAGIAAAFNAPIGACLYIYEEVSGVMKWNSWVTVLAMISATTATYCSLSLLAAIEETRSHLGALVLTGPGNNAMSVKVGELRYKFADIMIAALIGILCGLFSRIYAKSLLQMARFRRRRSEWHISLRLLEALVVTFCVGLALFYFPAIFGPTCEQVPKLDFDSPKKGRILASGEAGGLHFDHWTCGKDDHNFINTLLSGLEPGIQVLLEQYGNDFSIWKMALVFLLQFCGSLLIFGLPMPMGLFIPNLYFGALIGRMVGQAFFLLKPDDVASPDFYLANPGVFAFCGMGAAISGFSHMTISIAALIMEATHNIVDVVPLLTAIMAARMVAGFINHEGFDEEMLIFKNVPFLHTEMPPYLSSEFAADLMVDLSPESFLPVNCELAVIGRVLSLFPNLPYFPIVSDNRNKIIGLVPRKRIAKIFQNMCTVTLKDVEQMDPNFKAVPTVPLYKALTKKPSNRMTLGEFFEAQQAEAEGGDLRKLDTADNNKTVVIPEVLFPLREVMYPTRFLVSPTMPAARFYNMFVSMELQVVCVVDSNGLPVGIIPRENLIEFNPLTEPRDRPTRKTNAIEGSPRSTQRRQVSLENRPSGAVV